MKIPITKSYIKVFGLSLLTLIISCKKDIKIQSENILLQEWQGPYGGVPAFDKMDVKDIQEAVEKGMELNLSEIEAIANSTKEATFENTIEALERSGAELDRVFSYYGIMSSNVSSAEFREIQSNLAPKLSVFSSSISQNKALFDRIKTIYDASLINALESDKQRVLLLTYNSFAMKGAELDAEKKLRYAAIDEELSTLYNTFSDNVLHDEENYVTYLNAYQLDGLSEGFIKSAAAIATEKEKEGSYAITNTRSSMDPFLTYSTNRDLRKLVWTNYYARADNGGDYDNNVIIAEILKLRRERVELIGFKNYAEWRLQDRMAKNPENALALMEAVWPASVASVNEEVADMQTVADANGDGITIEPWDYRYYAEKVRLDKYDLNSDEVKQYLQLDKLRDAMFYVAGRLFNYNFSPVPEGSVPVFQEDVKVWEVTDKDSGTHIGLWYLDP